MGSLFEQFISMVSYTIIANTLTPVPFEAVSVTLGYLANLYGAPLSLAILAGASSIIGMDVIIYSFFRFFRGRLALVEKIMRREKVEAYRQKMVRHTGKTVLFLRFYPGPGVLSPVLSGALKIPLPKYLFYDAVGVILSIGFFVTVGDIFHASISTLLKGIGYEKHVVSIALVVIIGLALSWHIYKQYFRRMTAESVRYFLTLLRATEDKDSDSDGNQPSNR
jgi:membrane protein DedA with SNARE-associated domain